MATTKSVAPVTTSAVDAGKGFVYDNVTDQMVLVPLARTTRATFTNANYTATATDRIIAQTGTLSAARVVTLPAANAVPAGTSLQVVDESGTATGTNTISWARAGADTINGAAGNVVAVNAGYGSGWVESDGTSKWTTIAVSGGGATNLDALTDVAVTSPTTGHILRHDGTQFVNALGTAFFETAGTAVLKSVATTKGDLLAATAASTITRLAVGADGQILTADSTQTTGVKWATGSGTTDANAVHKGDLVYNIVDYGGVGDGVTDNSTALANVKTAAFSGSKPGVIYIPKGTWVIATGITAGSGLIVQTAGREATVISHTGNGSLFANSSPGTRIYGWQFFGGMTIVGNAGASAIAFNLADVSTSQFENVNVTSYTNSICFRVHSAASGNCVYNVFESCYAFSSSYGWYIDGVSSNDQRLIGCRVDSNTTAGIYHDTSNNLQLIGTSVEDNAVGLMIRNSLGVAGNSDQAQITNSRFETNTTSAIDIGANVRYATIVQPWFSGNGVDIVDAGTATHIVASARGQALVRLQNGATLLAEIDGNGAGKFATLGVGNSAAASTLGTVVRRMQVFDRAGTSLGYVPIYNSIT